MRWTNKKKENFVKGLLKTKNDFTTCRLKCYFQIKKTYQYQNLKTIRGQTKNIRLTSKTFEKI